MKKILYLFSDTGGGHRSAANAIIKAVAKSSKEKVDQKMVDVFLECSGFLNIFARLYAPVIKFSPKLWGQLYYWLDSEEALKNLEKISGPFILKELAALIDRENPDLIVSVHPMVNRLTVQALKDLNRNTPLLVVITDPVTLHRAWIAPEATQVLVATEEAKELCVKYGMPVEKIQVKGMPIDPSFSDKPEKKSKLRIKNGLKDNVFTILIMGGGEGGGGMEELIHGIEVSTLPVQLIVICGRNKKLEKKLKDNQTKYRFPMKVYGFTNQVPEIMAASDLIITKAGPGTIAEALAMDLPIILTSWLPGQEEGNVEFVLKEKVGSVVTDPKLVAAEVAAMMQPERSRDLKKNISRVRKPEAAFEIAKSILEKIK